MAFGWFGKKNGGGKTFREAERLRDQGRWAEALPLYEDAVADPATADEAGAGLRACRDHLVAVNLAEVEACQKADDPTRAREHADLALALAGNEPDLLERVRALGLHRGTSPAAEDEATPDRMFPPTCGCVSPCDEGPEPVAEDDLDTEDLFGFYLEALAEDELRVIEALDPGARDGFVRLQQGDLVGARTALEAAASRCPDAPGPVYVLGHLATLEEDDRTAADFYGRALGLDPTLASAAHHRAGSLKAAGDVEAAMSDVRAWLETRPDDPEARLILASCLLEGGQLEEAVAEADRSTAAGDESDVRPGLIRARAWRERGDPERMRQELQGVLRWQPNLLEALVPLGQMLIDQGGTAAERAVEVFKHCFRIDPDRGWWYLLRIAEAYGKRGWTTEAREVCDQAEPLLPEGDEARAQWEALSARF